LQIQSIKNLFEKENLKENNFHKIILKVYTLDTDIYTNLNKYLREGSEKIISNLFWYFFCLQHSMFLNFTDDFVLTQITEYR